MTKDDTKLKKVFPKSKNITPVILLTEIILGIILCLTSLIGFVFVASDVIEKEGINIDTALSHTAYSFRNPLLTQIMRTISFLGNEFIITASIIILIVLIIKKRKREATFFFVAIFFGFLLNTLLKFLLKIPRPTIDPIYQESFYSFPSGHAMNSFIFYGSLAYLSYHLTHNKRISVTISIISGILIFMIGFSRVYLGVHYPSDILGGFIAGFWWLVTVILIDKTFTYYNLRKLPKV